MREFARFVVYVALAALGVFALGKLARSGGWRSGLVQSENVDETVWDALMLASPQVLLPADTAVESSGRISAILVHDYTCVACRELYQSLETSMDALGIDTLFSIVIPRTESDSLAYQLSLLAWCAGSSAALPRAHPDLVDFGTRGRIPLSRREMATRWRIAPESLEACMRSAASERLIALARQAVIAAGIRGTPTLAGADGVVRRGVPAIAGRVGTSRR
ncbi:MAG TPA: hypothetical protein VGA37_01420 [Gemmatimonadales bacterium]